MDGAPAKSGRENTRNDPINREELENGTLIISSAKRMQLNST